MERSLSSRRCKIPGGPSHHRDWIGDEHKTNGEPTRIPRAEQNCACPSFPQPLISVAKRPLKHAEIAEISIAVWVQIGHPASRGDIAVRPAKTG